MFFNLVDLCSDCELMQRNKLLEEENIKLKNELDLNIQSIVTITKSRDSIKNETRGPILFTDCLLKFI